MQKTNDETTDYRPKTKQERMEDKRRILRIVLESPNHYKPEEIYALFYGQIEHELKIMFCGNKRESLHDLQVIAKEIAHRDGDKYISRLIRELGAEEILDRDSHNHLFVANPNRAIERYLPKGRDFYRDVVAAHILTGKVPAPAPKYGSQYRRHHRH